MLALAVCQALSWNPSMCSFVDPLLGPVCLVEYAYVCLEHLGGSTSEILMSTLGCLLFQEGSWFFSLCLNAVKLTCWPRTVTFQSRWELWGLWGLWGKGNWTPLVCQMCLSIKCIFLCNCDQCFGEPESCRAIFFFQPQSRQPTS